MNAKRKESALKKFTPLVADNTRDSLKAVILADDKDYTDNETEEILEILYTNTHTKKLVAEPILPTKKIAADIVDTGLRPSGTTGVTQTGGTGADSEWIRNKETGNEQKMNGEAARKLSRRKPHKFEIIVKK